MISQSWTVSLATALLLGCSQPHVGSSREAAVLAADSARIVAMLSDDTVALDSLLHSELIYTHSNGVIDSKQSLLEGLMSGRVDYRSIEVESAVVRIHGDAAVVTGRVRMEVAAGEAVHHLLSNYTTVYWWEEGRWQMVAYQSCAAA